LASKTLPILAKKGGGIHPYYTNYLFSTFCPSGSSSRTLAAAAAAVAAADIE
jgi:hypothetical protein